MFLNFYDEEEDEANFDNDVTSFHTNDDKDN